MCPSDGRFWKPVVLVLSNSFPISGPRGSANIISQAVCRLLEVIADIKQRFDIPRNDWVLRNSPQLAEVCLAKVECDLLKAVACADISESLAAKAQGASL